jgi:hypothetical protein
VGLIAIILLCLGFLSAAGSVVTNSGLATLVSLGLLLASAEVYVLSKIFDGFSPLHLPIITINTTYLLGAFFWDAVSPYTNFAYKFPPQQDLTNALAVCIAYCAAFTFGVTLAAVRLTGRVPIQQNRGISKLPDNFAAMIDRTSGILVLIGFGSIIIYLFTFQGAILSGRYQEFRGPYWAAAISEPLGMLGMICFAVLATRKGRFRGVALAGFAVLTIILFAYATRILALIPAALVLGRLTARGGIRGRNLILAIIATVLLLGIPLAARSNPEGVGLINTTALVLTAPTSTIFSSNLPGLAGTVLASVPLTAEVMGRYIPPQAFWASVSPLPGGLAGWHDVRGTLLLDENAPFNSLGELGAHGWLAVFGVALISGFILAKAAMTASRQTGPLGFGLTVAVYGFALIFSVLILQYNLRTSTRLIYYAIALATAVKVASTFLRRPPNQGLDDGALRHVNASDKHFLATREVPERHIKPVSK